MIITYRTTEEALHESRQLDLLDSRYGGSNLEPGVDLSGNLELYQGLELVEHLALSLEGSQLHVNCIDHQLRKLQ